MTSTLKAPGKIIVGVLSPDSKVHFESGLKTFFQTQWSQCANCELKNLGVYKEDGLFDEKSSLEQLNSLQGVSFLFLNFNLRYQEKEHKTLVEQLKKITAAPMLVLGSAGYPKEGEPSAQLSKTLLGQVPDMIILGEINERERMPSPAFFGPQLLTAVRPPKSFIGKQLGPAYFVAKFAPHYSRRLPQGWLNHFYEKKAKSRKIWPQAEDFLN